MLRRPPRAAGPLLPAMVLAAAIAAPHAAAAGRPATIENDAFAINNPARPHDELRRCDVVLGLSELFSVVEVAACSNKDFAAVGNLGTPEDFAPSAPGPDR